MKRRAMQFCFALGLLLTLATGLVFFSGFRTGHEIYIWRKSNDETDVGWVKVQIIATGWKLGFVSTEDREWAGPAPDPPIRYYTLVPSPPRLQPLGFQYTYSVYRDGAVVLRTMFAPTWFVLLCCATFSVATGLPVWRMRRWRSRQARGLCPACGYDLRGAAHERCPECGQIVAPPQPV